MGILIVLAASLIPIALGFVWYNDKVFGKAWRAASGTSDEKLSGGKMALKFGLVFLLSFMLAFMLQSLVIHQHTINSIMFNFMEDLADPNSAASQFKADAVTLLTGVHRSFGHGALHGGIAGVFLALPFIGINALFERKSFKYVAIHAGFWIISLILMGGVICQFAPPVLQ